MKGGNYTSLGTCSGINVSGNVAGTRKMSLGKSIKMYLTIFILTTCIYMALYQYHISREPFAASEVVKVSSYLHCEKMARLLILYNKIKLEI